MKPILIHAHMFYSEYWPDLVQCIKNIKEPYDLYITYVDKNLDLSFFTTDFPNAKIILSENKGFDIYPFIKILDMVNLDKYSYVLKLHTKRNFPDDYKINNISMKGDSWRMNLLTPFHTRQNWKNTLKTIKQKYTGMVGNGNLMIHESTDWDKLLPTIKKTVKKLGLPYKGYTFFGGTMFIIRANLLKVLQNKQSVFKWSESSTNKNYLDDVYSYERLFGAIVNSQNYKVKAMKDTKKHNLFKFFYKQKNEKILDGTSKRVFIFGIRLLKVLYKNNVTETYLFNTKIRTKFLNKKQKLSSDITNYGQWITELKQDKSKFVPFTTKTYKRHTQDPKIFAYYLAQFHSIPINDDAHGRGFTEWTNVSSCAPQYIGHEQPKIPYDIGFYNLRDINVMKRQAELANAYGIYGWCFYWYWFDGKKALEEPLYNFLNSDIDIHFHLCWANENWSKLWDGGNSEIILKQETEYIDADKFFADILPFIKDKRYEKIDNKPILMLYKPSSFTPSVFQKFLSRMDELAKDNGFDGFFFMGTNANGFDEPKKYGLPGIIEFPPHGLGNACKILTKDYISKKCNLLTISLTDWINNKGFEIKKDHLVFKCCFPAWDNSPRKAYSNGAVYELDVNDFKKWLSGIIKWTRKTNPENMQYVYINAWNEWAEGAILEPTVRHGYKNLDTVKTVLENLRK